MSIVKVYSVPGSPYLAAVLFALEERQASHAFVPWQLSDLRTEAHLAMHPFGRMPVMEHGEFRLYETQAMLRYIADAFPGEPLVPDDICARARMNQLMGICDWYFFPKFASIAVWERVIKPQVTGQPADQAVIERSMPMGRTCIQEFARLMGEGPYLTGETLSLADIHWAPQIYYLALTPEGDELLGPHKAIKPWLARMRERPAMSRTMLFGI
ncbi:MAG: glutathione S-transferase family protein [Rhodomicrobium sp.]